jgi:hypothetical protein
MPAAAASAVTPLESTLVARAAAGDVRAFRSIYDRHAPVIYRFLCDMLRDRSAADEALQETFVRAHGRLSTLREAEKLRSWLFGIARAAAHRRGRALEAALGELRADRRAALLMDKSGGGKNVMGASPSKAQYGKGDGAIRRRDVFRRRDAQGTIR